MHLVLTLLRKDYLNFKKDRVAVGLTFLVPIVLIYIFGQVFGVNRKDTGPVGIPLAIVNQSSAPEIATLVDALKREKAFRVVETETDAQGRARALTEDVVRAGFKSDRFRFALVFPADATSDARFGLRMKFLTNPRNEIETQTVTGLLQKTVYTAAPQLLMQSLRKQAVEFIGAKDTDKFYGEIAGSVSRAFSLDEAKVRETMARGEIPRAKPVSARADGSSDASTSGLGDFMERVIKIEKEQLAGAQVTNAAATRVVGGWAMMFLLFSLSGMATSLFEEKKAGIFLRLLSAPVRRSHLLWSKYLFGIALGLVQLVTLFFAGRLMFGIDVLSNFGNLVVICLVAAMACTAFGMLLASITRTQAAASGLATLLILTMSSIGGAWFPTSFMPEFIQKLSKLTVVYWSMEGFALVLWNGCTFAELLPTLGVLLGMSAVLVAISLWRFRRGPIFD
ncbi:MAG: ABC transporter permease [Candidatus Didemnitutus sp.]|nr:ABC transporter permease [Candidatus Didemnitutus sp.]